MQQHNRGQKDPVCFLKQERSSIWADLQLPFLRWDQVSNICILLMTVLQLMASSECTRFTVSLSPDTEICSLGHFLTPLALLTAASMQQTAADPGVRAKKQQQGQQLGAPASIKSVSSKLSSNRGRAGAYRGHHSPQSKGMGMSLCIAMPQTSS